MYGTLSSVGNSINSIYTAIYFLYFTISISKLPYHTLSPKCHIIRTTVKSLIYLLLEYGVPATAMTVTGVPSVLLGSDQEEFSSGSSSPSWFGGVGTFKDVLESPHTTKIFFDVRNDADALFAHFNIHLRGTMDLQLLENFKRCHCHESTRFVHSLVKCIRQDSRMMPEDKRAWEDAKEKGRRMFAPERGGQYAVLDERPLQNDIMAYCVQDVFCMPDLWQVYSHLLPHSLQARERVVDWQRMIKTATKMRVKDAESTSYDPHSRENVLTPGWATVIYDSGDSDEDYDLPSPPETGRDFEGIEDSD